MPPVDDDEPKTRAPVPLCPIWTPPTTKQASKKRTSTKSIYLILDFNKKHKDDIDLLEEYVTSNCEQLTAPPPDNTKEHIVWSMLDSGSGPMVADCEKFFPQHKIRESPAQKQGTKYVSASGGLIANEGQIDLVHRQGNDLFEMTMQHAKVNCPILSVRYFTDRDCRVLFRKGGGVIIYPNGKRIAFIERLGVFFVALNVLPPEQAADIKKKVQKARKRREEAEK